MATIVATGSGRWKAVIRKNGWPTTIKTFRLKRDAEDWARRTEDEMVRGVYIQRAPSERMTVDAALDRYLRDVTPTKRPTTQLTEKRRAVILRKHLGRYSLAAITPDLVASYRDQRLAGSAAAGEGDEGPRAGNTVRVELALLSHLFSVAIREWKLGLISNPVQSIRKPKVAPHRTRRLRGDEEQSLFSELAAHSNPMLLWIAGIALTTGMRASEINTLERGQIDLHKRVVKLSLTKNGDGREVPLGEEALKYLRQALAHPIRLIDSDLLFFGEPGRRDKARRPYTFNKVWAEARKRAGLVDYHFHDLRHEFASRLAEGGMDARKIAAILGHRDIKMSMIYVNLYGRDLVEEVDVALNARRARGLR